MRSLALGSWLAAMLACTALSAQAPPADPSPTSSPTGIDGDIDPPAPSPTAGPSPTPTGSRPPAGGAAGSGGGPDGPNGTGPGGGDFAWGRDVLAPLLRLAGIGLILYLVIWGLNLDKVLKAELWTERTIIALAIVLTFCALLLLGEKGEVLGVAKDIVLIVVGFYFGVSKTGPEGRSLAERARDREEPSGDPNAGTAPPEEAPAQP